jgi:GNAT superfamily N-acetyltransferase
MLAQLAASAGIETAYLAELDGHAVGFACLRLIPTLFSAAPYAELTELFVEAAYRRHGVGRALMRFVEAEAQAAGATELFLLTGFKNTGAHHFYHATGYSLRCFTMHKSLES